MTKQRRSFSAEFKREAADLVLKQNYSYIEASRSLGIGESALRRWVDQVQKERQCPYLPHVFLALTNYIDATDRTDSELILMKPWSTLERLTMTHDSATLIKIASFFIKTEPSAKRY